jgi:uncharacterized damage-inducible protein DinB
MLGKTMLVSMVEYHRQANERLLDQAAELSDAALDQPIDGSGGRSIRETIRHAADTDHRWRCFVETHFPVWEEHDPANDSAPLRDLAAFQSEETALLAAWLERQSEPELMQEIEVTWQGETSRISPWHGLLQMLLHAQQHRAELALALTLHGHSPNDLDYIIYV